MSAREADSRMTRLMALGEQAARASERRFAGAVARAAEAAANLSHIEGLIMTAAPVTEARGVAALAAAAHLRALLVPAAVAAEARLSAAVEQRRIAEARLRQDQLRAQKLAERAGSTRRVLISDITRREHEDRPASTRKVHG